MYFIGKKYFSLSCRITEVHTGITESISDKQKQSSNAHPAVRLGAVSQHLLEANRTGESFSKNPALHPVTTDSEHINKKMYGSAEGCSSKTLSAVRAHLLLYC